LIAIEAIVTSEHYKFSNLFWITLLGLAGIAHFLHPQFFVAYYPSYLPFPQAAVWVSGLVEWVLAGMLATRYRIREVWLVISLLMTVYLTVHLYVITHHHVIQHPTPSIPLWLAWIRLPLQLALILWPIWILRSLDDQQIEANKP